MHGTATLPRRWAPWKGGILLVSCLLAGAICLIVDSLWALPVIIVVAIMLAAVGMANNGRGFDAFIWSPWTYKTLEGGDEVTRDP